MAGGALKVREKNLGKGLAYTLTLMVFTVVMVQWVLPEVLGGITKRPEGLAYRYLDAVSAGEFDRAADYTGDVGMSARLTDFERVDDGDWFERIEVGRGVDRAGPFVGRYVPVLIVRRDAEDSEERTIVRLTARMSSEDVMEIRPRAEGDPRVPSEGGEYPARAPLSAWIAALLIGVGLTAVATLVLEAAPEPGSPGN